MVLERPDLARLHRARAEVVEDRRLHLLVDDPARPPTGSATRDLAAVERGDRLGRSSQRRLEDRGGALAVGLGRHERHPHVPLAGGAEERSRRDEDAVLEQPRARTAPTGPSTASQRKNVASPPACAEPLCARARAGASRACGGSSSRTAATCSSSARRRPRPAGRTPAAPSRPKAGRPAARRRSPARRADEPERYPVIEERFESVLKHDDVGCGRDLERRDGRLGEPELGVRLVGAEQEAVLARARRELLVEGERRGRAGRVVRVAGPEERELVPERRTRRGRAASRSPRGAAPVIDVPPPAKSAPRS